MPEPTVAARPPGKVYLVGAGPGDPGLMTLRGIECLARAELVLYDYLVNPQILRHAPATAEVVCLGHHGRDRIMSQDEVSARMVATAQQGRTVIRLKGGDPSIFGRLAEELEALRAAAIPFEVVPGITAALAAGSYAGIPITHRGCASAVALVTGHQQDGSPRAPAEYAALAVFPGTLVFYMGVTTADEWTQALISAGKPAGTPAVIVRRCSWPDQVIVHCTLGTVASKLAQARIRPPVLTIVGEVAAVDSISDWFTARPLFGTRVLVTRPEEQSAGLVTRLTDLGADCIVQPAIEIGPPNDWAPVDAALDRLDRHGWLVFSSANGVRYLLDRLLARGRDLRSLHGIRLAVIGPGTREELARYHLQADLQPETYRAESLADALLATGAKRFLLARASRGREVLAERLEAAGADVEQIVVYHSHDVAAAGEAAVSALIAGRIDWVTVTSSAIAQSLARLFGDSLRRAKLASISPLTSSTLAELGYSQAAEAAEYTMDGVVDAILRAVTNDRGQGA